MYTLDQNNIIQYNMFLITKCIHNLKYTMRLHPFKYNRVLYTVFTVQNFNFPDLFDILKQLSIFNINIADINLLIIGQRDIKRYEFGLQVFQFNDFSESSDFSSSRPPHHRGIVVTHGTVVSAGAGVGLKDVR